jgi:hypothetical protein
MFDLLFNPEKKGRKTNSLSERILSSLYWENAAYEIASEGIYNKKDFTPIESVYMENVYEILKYITVKTARTTLTSEHQQLAHDESIKKQRRRK